MIHSGLYLHIIYINDALIDFCRIYIDKYTKMINVKLVQTDENNSLQHFS